MTAKRISQLEQKLQAAQRALNHSDTTQKYVAAIRYYAQLAQKYERISGRAYNGNPRREFTDVHRE